MCLPTLKVAKTNSSDKHTIRLMSGKDNKTLITANEKLLYFRFLSYDLEEN